MKRMFTTGEDRKRKKEQCKLFVIPTVQRSSVFIVVFSIANLHEAQVENQLQQTRDGCTCVFGQSRRRLSFHIVYKFIMIRTWFMDKVAIFFFFGQETGFSFFPPPKKHDTNHGKTGWKQDMFLENFFIS